MYNFFLLWWASNPELSISKVNALPLKCIPSSFLLLYTPALTNKQKFYFLFFPFFICPQIRQKTCKPNLGKGSNIQSLGAS